MVSNIDMRPPFLTLMIIAASVAFLGDNASALDDVRRDTPSGNPVPRFVSLKGPKDNCRVGPSRQHDVRYIYARPGLPVKVIAETVDHWRKIRDAGGDECWVYRSRLINLSHVLALDDTALRRTASTSADLRGQIEKGVLARIIRMRRGWVLVEADNLRGWAPVSAFWGASS